MAFASPGVICIVQRASLNTIEKDDHSLKCNEVVDGLLSSEHCLLQQRQRRRHFLPVSQDQVNVSSLGLGGCAHGNSL